MYGNQTLVASLGVAGEKCHCSFAGAEVSLNCMVAHTSSSFTLYKRCQKAEVMHVEQEYFETFFFISYM